MDSADTYWGSNQDLADQAYQRYLMQVALADLWLGKIMEKLHESALFSQSLLVVVSDHGASFIAGDASRKLTKTNYESVLPIPLFIKRPQQSVGHIDDSYVEITDILPTVAELLEITLPIAVDGKPIGSDGVIQRKTKRMYDFFSRWENLPVDVEASMFGRQALVQRRVALFGEAGQGGLYDLGPHRELLGRPVSDFESSPSDAGLSIDQASLLQEVDADSGFLPGLITGRLLNAESPPSPWIMLAINGVLGASAPLYLDASGEWTYSGLLPEAGFKQGHNVVELFFVSKESEKTHLRIAGNSGASRFWLEDRKSATVVMYEQSNEDVTLSQKRLHGYVDTAITQERLLEVSGWAIDPEEKVALKQLLVFANGRGVLQAQHNGLQRADILRHHGVPNSGFRVILPRSLLKASEKLEIRIVGVAADGSASELAYTEGFEWRPGR